MTKLLAILPAFVWGLSCLSLAVAQNGSPPQGLLESQELAGEPTLTPASWFNGCDTCTSCDTCTNCACDACGARGCYFVGAEYLSIRPHFSQAVHFARGVQTPTLFNVVGDDMEFDYDLSIRAHFGRRVGCSGARWQFTCWWFEGDTAHGGAAEPGEFLVDPFGNVVGSVAIVDARDGRFTPPPPFGSGPTILTGGDLIQTRTSVEIQVYDLEFLAPVTSCDCRWRIEWSAGIRFADIEQVYQSRVTTAGVPLAEGFYAADFIGAGPTLGGTVGQRLGGGLSWYSKARASLLVGDTDLNFGNSVFAPVPFTAGQAESMTRTVPVFELELGLNWRPSCWLDLSVGWLVQSWFDLGASGGQFGGFFTGVDDTNVMSFDGGFARATVSF